MEARLVQSANSVAIVIDNPQGELLNYPTDTTFEVTPYGKRIVLSPTIARHPKPLPKVTKEQLETIGPLTKSLLDFPKPNIDIENIEDERFQYLWKKYVH